MNDFQQNGYITIDRDQIASLIEQATPTQLALFVVLKSLADWTTGTWLGNLNTLVQRYGFGETKIRENMEHLHRLGVIFWNQPLGQRGSVPVLINDYQVGGGPMKGYTLCLRTGNDAINTDPYNPDYRKNDSEDTTLFFACPSRLSGAVKQMLEDAGSRGNTDDFRGNTEDNSTASRGNTDSSRGNTEAKPCFHGIKPCASRESEGISRGNTAYSADTIRKEEEEGKEEELTNNSATGVALKLDSPTSSNSNSNRNCKNSSTPIPAKATTYRPSPNKSARKNYVSPQAVENEDPVQMLADHWESVRTNRKDRTRKAICQYVKKALETIPNPDTLKKLMSRAWEEDDYIQYDAEFPIAAFATQDYLLNLKKNQAQGSRNKDWTPPYDDYEKKRAAGYAARHRKLTPREIAEDIYGLSG